MEDKFLTLKGVSVQVGGRKVLDGLDWEILRGQQWAVTGPSGSGKTVLAHMLQGRHFHSGEVIWHGGSPARRKSQAADESGRSKPGNGQADGTGKQDRPRISIVDQQHRFRNRPGTTDLYYQQRFNSSDAELTITVAQELQEYTGQILEIGTPEEQQNSGSAYPEKSLRQKDQPQTNTDRGTLGVATDRLDPSNREAGSEDPTDQPNRTNPTDQAGHAHDSDQEWLDSLHIRSLLSRPLIQLSNGENKRVQLAIALLEKPDLLILDNPFLGLDTAGREVLHKIIDMLAAKGIQLILITDARELPEAITHVVWLEKGQLHFSGSRKSFLDRQPAETAPRVELPAHILERLKELSAGDQGEDFSTAVKMVDVNVHYGEKLLLQDISWEVRKGERWNVSGPNGAGKSTLLSLITADNPQAYANEIWLFDRRRGTGETIWEIKRKIGFVSPELHLYFDYSATCLDVIASGLFDTIGLFRPLNTAQEEHTLLWMQLLSLDGLRTRRLAQLSTGQQRMVLLARALIKNPPMLILDEPCQGLDDQQTAYFRELIGLLCVTFDKTLIYVSHYRQELPDCIDRYLRLDNGKMLR